VLERHFTCRLVLDLEGASCLDEVAVNQLVALTHRIIARHGTIRLCGLSAYNRGAIERCGGMRYLPIYADIGGALFAELGPRSKR
jgi:anti-anti-sigma regulatory factor